VNPAAVPTDAPPRPGAGLIANLVGQLAFGLLAMTICLPSMPDWAQTFDATQAAVQFSFSGFVLTYGGLQLLYGPLSDRVGRKPVLLAGLALATAASVMAALAPSLGWLLVARVLQGAGCAAGMVIGRALVQDLFHGAARTRVMAYIGMAMGLCPPTATILGGHLHVQVGWQANFVLMAVLGAVLLAGAWRGLPEPARNTPRGSGPWWRGLAGAYGQLAREPGFLLYVAVLAMTTATFYAFLGGAPIVLGSYGVGADGIGYYIMCIPLAYIVGNWVTSHVVHRTGDAPVMFGGQGVALGGIVLMLGLAIAGIDTPLALALPLTLLGLGHGLLVPPTLTGTVGLVPALAGAASAVAGLMQQLMGAAGGYLVGLVPHHGARNLGWIMLALSSSAAVAMLALHWRRPGAAPA
jgi:DHA1 family bicyclomycin/chloramphenicol resistance-like MFS transporter